MIPGPAPLDDDVLAETARPIAAHYGREWVRLHRETTALAQRAFQTAGSVYLLFSSGTGGMEALINGVLAPGDRALVVVNGYFGVRLRSLLEAHGVEPVCVTAPWGRPIDPAAVRAVIERERNLSALLVVHHETSTGVLNPLDELGALARAYDLAYLVDAISSLGGETLEMDAWGIDGCVGVGNKVLGAPVGLAMTALGPRYWTLADRKQNSTAGWYLNLRTWRHYAEEWGDWHPTPVTMSSHVLAALHRVLTALHAEGLAQRVARQRALAAAFRAGLRARGFEPYVDGPSAASVMTAVCRPSHMDVAAFIDWLAREQNILIAGGLGETRGQIFRVGHMGAAASPAWTAGFLDALDVWIAEASRLPA